MLLGLALLLGGCSRMPGAQPEYIGIEQAKTAVLAAAGVSPEQASFSIAGLEKQDGEEFYAVEFAAEGKRYQYRVDPVSGYIMSSKVTNGAQEGSSASAPASSGTDNSSQPPASSQAPAGDQTPAGSQGSASSGSLIGTEAAQKAALAHAGVAADQVRFLETRLEWEDGQQVYDVEFYQGSTRTEYDYSINASTGAVVKHSFESSAVAAGENDQALTAEQAAALALAKVPGASQSDLIEFETDYDHGRLEYEGKILYGGMEYEFEIDGSTGRFLNWEVDTP